jgi:hypothetical protein
MAAHESGHALYYTRREIETTWRQELDRLRISPADARHVSIYASTNPAELFSEVTALIADGRRLQVPERILRAYDAAVAKLKVP